MPLDAFGCLCRVRIALSDKTRRSTEIYTLSLHDALPIPGRGYISGAPCVFSQSDRYDTKNMDPLSISASVFTLVQAASAVSWMLPLIVLVARASSLTTKNSTSVLIYSS